MAKKISTKFKMICYQCGAEMPVYLVDNDRFLSHCFGCGKMMFGPAPLLNRLEFTDTACPHKPELKQCKNGKGLTSWCDLCRVRTFYRKHPGKP